jgi:hypothetical protein
MIYIVTFLVISPLLFAIFVIVYLLRGAKKAATSGRKEDKDYAVEVLILVWILSFSVFDGFKMLLGY